MPTAIRASSVLVVALFAAGCVRSRHPELRSTAPTVAPPPAAASVAEPDAGIGLVIAEPVAGMSASSPIHLTGRLGDTTGRVAVAQVLSVDASGRETRRGNAMLRPEGSDGHYVVDVAYTLDASSPGVVEVVLVEPESGTVTERARVSIVLEPAPAP